jgi:peptidoglycan hydrolase CwlO-like protein
MSLAVSYVNTIPQLCRKDGEIASANSKLESEQALVAQLQKKIKELQVSI